MKLAVGVFLLVLVEMALVSLLFHSGPPNVVLSTVGG